MPINDRPRHQLLRPKFLQLSEGSWVAVAQLATDQSLPSKNRPTNKTPLAIQRLAVRELCQSLLKHLDYIDEIEESFFPYRLKQNGDYLCFTHSHDYVAVVLNASRPCGIDLELSEVRWQTVQRFYHPEELALLERIEPDLRQVLCRYLWQIKECFVKVEQGLLIPTLGQSLAPYLPELLTILTPYSSQTAYPIPRIEASLIRKNHSCIKLSLPMRLDNSNYYIHLSPYSRLVSLS